MSAVHGYKPVGYLNEMEEYRRLTGLPDKEVTRLLSYCETAGLTILYASQHPKGCPARLAGGHVGGGLRCERGCQTLHACKERFSEHR